MLAAIQILKCGLAADDQCFDASFAGEFGRDNAMTSVLDFVSSVETGAQNHPNHLPPRLVIDAHAVNLSVVFAHDALDHAFGNVDFIERNERGLPAFAGIFVALAQNGLPFQGRPESQLTANGLLRCSGLFPTYL